MPTVPPAAGGWPARIERACADIAAAGRWRAPRDLDRGGPHALLGTTPPRPVVQFASNDYLGLGRHPAVRAAATAAIAADGTGTGASRLVVGSRPAHRELETELAAWRGTEAAVLFPTGYMANLGVLTTFATAGVLVCSDERNHASIIDGCRLARGDTRIYRHGDLDHLASLLAGSDGPAVVVTDTVFSMDGDVAPVEAIAELCLAHDALLVLDEAHAVLGPDPVLPDDLAVVRVGTLSKALGSLGGFAATTTAAAELLVNRARPYIFTTAPTPADTAAARAALAVVRAPDGARLRARLLAHVERLAPGHPSPILPVVVGTEDDAVAASAALAGLGLFVPAIRPPTVAPGTSRLRVALSAEHTDEDIDRLHDALDGLGLAGRLVTAAR